MSLQRFSHRPPACLPVAVSHWVCVCMNASCFRHRAAPPQIGLAGCPMPSHQAASVSCETHTPICSQGAPSAASSQVRHRPRLLSTSCPLVCSELLLHSWQREHPPHTTHRPPCLAMLGWQFAWCPASWSLYSGARHHHGIMLKMRKSPQFATVVSALLLSALGWQI